MTGTTIAGLTKNECLCQPEGEYEGGKLNLLLIYLRF